MKLLRIILSILLLSVSFQSHAMHSVWDGPSHSGSDPEAEIDYENDELNESDPCTGSNTRHSSSASYETGSPVVIKNGSLIWSEVDVVVNGHYPLYLKRTFSSRESTRGMFGKGWVSNCERTLTKIMDFEALSRGASNVDRYMLRLANGKLYPFGDDDSLATRPNGIYADIEEDGDQVLLKWAGGKTDTFENGRLIREEDEHGNYIEYTYDNLDRVSRMETGDGRWISFDYPGDSPYVELVEDNTGRSWSYGYDSEDNLTSVQGPSGTRTYEYLPPGSFEGVGFISYNFAFLTKVTDATGVVELEADYITDTIFGLGRVRSYDAGLTHYEYEYFWEAQDLFTTRIVKAVKTGDGKQWTYNLSNTGQVEEEITPDGTITYDLNSDFKSTETSFNTGYTLTTTFDDLGRPRTINNGRANFGYEYTGNFLTPTKITLPNSLGSYVYRLNNDGDIYEYEDLDGNLYELKYYPNGTIREVILPGATKSWKFTYNGYGLLRTVESPEGKTETFLRNNRGFITTYRNGNSKEWTYTYDQLGRKKSELTPEGAYTTFDYDEAGRLEKVTNDSGETYVYDYDDFGRLESKKTFWNGTYTYQYYPGTYRVSKVIHPDLSETEYFYYSSDNRLRRKQAPDQYVDYEYDPYGRLERLTNNSGSVRYQYNPWNEITQETVNGQTLGYQIDDLGRLEVETRFGVDLVYSYNTNGLLRQIVTPAGNVGYGYDSWSRLEDITRPNGINTHFDYYDDDTIQKITHGVVGALTYVLDDARRITNISGFGNSKTYTYDDDDRLTSVAYGVALSDGTVSESFAYNDLGNRIDNGEMYDVGSQLTRNNAYIFTYDDSGNLATRLNSDSGAYEVFSYNTWNQLTRYRFFDSQSATLPSKDYSYTYGPEGRRWSKSGNDGTSYFYWSGSSLIGEESSGVLTKHFPELIDISSNYYYPLSDHLGTTKRIVDGLGQTVWSGESKAFGQTLVTNESVIWNLRFPGQVTDTESGLHYNYRRDYDPVSGRYLQSDPIGVAGGLNLYAYADNNPAGNIDPTGEASLAVGGGVIILGGGAIAYGACAGSGNPWCEAVRGLGDRCLDGIGAVFNESGDDAEAEAKPKKKRKKREGDFTRGQKKKFKEENAENNGGRMRCEDCDKEVKSVGNKKGEGTPDNQAQIHHEPPIYKGGGRDSKGVVLCPPCHILRHLLEK